MEYKELDFEYGEREYPFDILTTGGTILGGSGTLSGAIAGAREMASDEGGCDLDVYDNEKKRVRFSIRLEPWGDLVEKAETIEQYAAKDRPGKPTGFSGTGWAVVGLDGGPVEFHAFRYDALKAAGRDPEAVSIAAEAV